MAPGEEVKPIITLDNLLKDQNVDLDSLNRCMGYVETLNPDSRVGPVLENRAKHLFMCWSSFVTRHYQIHQVATSEEIKIRSYFVKKIFEITEAKYLAISDILSLWMTAANPIRPAMQPAVPGGSTDHSNVKLQPISIPKFSGKLTDYASFRDSFESLIIRKQSLSDLEKLHYLKGLMEGEAHELLCNIPLVATNFQVAWDLLRTRYSNTRASVNMHLNDIFAIEPIKRESASSLLNMRNVLKRNLAALTNLNRPVDNYADILIYRLVARLDNNTHRDWEIQLAANTNCPTYDDFDNFLLTRIRALEALNPVEITVKSNQTQNKQSSNQSKGNTSRNNKSIVANSYVVSDKNLQCSICNENHKIYKCSTFQNMSSLDRFNKIKSLHLCVNCLAAGHKIQECSSKYTCHECKMKHHTLLHRDNSKQTKNELDQSQDKNLPSTSGQAETKNIQSHFLTTGTLKEKRVMLATVKLCVLSNSNQKIPIRALLDQGSTWSFISNKAANLLNVKRNRVSASLSGLSGTSAVTATSVVELNLCPIHSETPMFTTQALVIPRITTYAPERNISLEKWTHFENLKFSDDITSDEEIHMLIGADLYGALILNDIRKGGNNEPVAQNTVFGWVLSGPVTPSVPSNSNTISVLHCASFEQLNSALTKFWDIENVTTEKPVSPQDEFCESHFMSTHKRTTTGQYMVQYPFKSETLEIGESRHIAERSLKRIEIRIEKDPEHKKEYNSFMSVYESLGHMTLSPNPHVPPHRSVYLPHHPIIREHSQTTKLRVVFNASSKTANGTSLNDHMLTGPKLQPDLSIILSQWRTYPFVFTADITKMYRQILIDPIQRNYQRVLWRPSSDLPISEYQLATVTYGTRSAPYLALRVMKQLVSDEGSDFPLASLVLWFDTFIDDFLFGAHDKKTAKLTREEVVSLLKRAQLEARKWASNDPSLIADVDPSNHGLAWGSSDSQKQAIKVLGISWKFDTDTFHFTVNIEVPKTLTHRQALSLLAQLFDPVGWISPVIVVGKILMQKTWLSKATWDESLPTPLQNEWLNYFLSLNDLSKIAIPRWNRHDPNSSRSELHGFADASDLAYGAVIYLRTVRKTGEIFVSLITSKTKVCPLKKLSIPRLELQAAVLLAQLFTSLKKARAFTEIPVQCWTDSKVVLAWLSKHASAWKLFVANRVAEVQTLLPSQKWRHVPTNSNSADLASRGLWWNGPDWLMHQPDQWPSQISPSEEESSVEIKTVTHLVNDPKNHPLYNLTIKFSSWEKTVRVVAYVKKFVDLFIETMKRKIISQNKIRDLIRNCHSIAKTEPVKQLTAKDLSNAKVVLYKILQAELFSPEIKTLTQKNFVSARNQLHSLNPFLDEQGVIRVGGRLENSSLPFEGKHPVILKRHPLVTSLIISMHSKCLHGGMKLTLSTLRQQVWIINPRPQIKSVLFKCLLCAKIRASLATQLMSNLPQSRVTKPERAFFQCGLDYAGPLQVRLSSGRGHKFQACYIALFICLSVKAIHLELVSDYSSDSFIVAYQRFCARRGIPAHLYSDRGTNFQGACRILKEEFARVVIEPDFKALLARDNVTWHFIPPAAPHFGGI